MEPLHEGMRAKATAIVSENNFAKTMGSGDLPVFATPAMLALMEQAAAQSVLPALSDEETTVGVHADIQHTAASAVGQHITAESELIRIEGRKLFFTVRACDTVGEIGNGTHERVIVKRERFMEKTQAR